MQRAFFSSHQRLARMVAASVVAWSVLAVSQAQTDPRRDDIVRVTEQVMPSVVNISTESIVESRDLFESVFRSYYGRPSVQSSIGSGVIISDDGYLLTNLHVVKRANRIQVKLSDAAGGGVYDVEPTYYVDPPTDIALLKIVPHKKGEKFKAIHFAKDDDLLLGETVLALGNPFGLGESVTKGILSSKRRAAPKENQDLKMENWLQTDALINPGNSGGPLVDLRGDMIGINNAVLERAQGIGFAIPVKEVRQAMGGVFNAETAGRWFGAQISVNAPLTVRSVEADSPAGRAGLKTGDIIIDLNGQAAASFMDFTRTIRGPGDMNFTMTVRRGDDTRQMNLHLQPLAELFRRRMGMDLQELTPDLVRQMGLRQDSGLLITRVEKGGPADRADLQEYDVLEGIGEQPTHSFVDAHAALASFGPGDLEQLSVLVPRTKGNLILGYRAGETELKLR